MKNLLLRNCLIAGALTQTIAQVSKSAFTAGINTFSTAVSKNNVSSQNSALNTLNGMMNSQIAYLNSNISLLQAEYVADTSTAGITLRRSAIAIGQAKNSIATHPNNLQVEKQAQADLVLDKRQYSQAEALENTANNLRSTIQQNTANLATDNTVYNNIQRLENTKGRNNANIINNLNQFAATLQ